MQNFPQNPMMNMGGMTGFFFIPAPFVSVLPPSINGIVSTPLQIIGGGGFFSGYATKESLDFNEPASQDDNGTSYKQTINGLVPGSSPELSALMQEMELYRHYVLMRDPAGYLRLVGYDAPLIFMASSKSGQKPTDYKGFSFTFSGDSLTRAPYYQLT